MMSKKEIGRQAEDMAARFLREMGFEILFRNYRYGRAEIDLIAKKHDLLVFVEVKYRSYTAFGHPEQTVSPAQQLRIHHAAEHYMQHGPAHRHIRFDIIAVVKRGDAWVSTHFEDAF
jgi:putative endonuclease